MFGGVVPVVQGFCGFGWCGAGTCWFVVSVSSHEPETLIRNRPSRYPSRCLSHGTLTQSVS